MARYIIVHELKSEVQLVAKATVREIAVIGGFLGIGWLFSGFVSPYLTIPFYIFNGFVGFFLALRSPFNPQKHMYHTLIYFLTKDRTVYIPIHNRLTKEQLSQSETWLKLKNKEGDKEA